MKSSMRAARVSWSSPPRSAPSGSRARSAAPCKCSSTASEGDTAIARSAGDAPEIDGTVRIRGAKGLKVGQFADVHITGAGPYDLEARLEARL